MGGDSTGTQKSAYLTFDSCLGDLASTENTKRLTDEMRVEQTFDDSFGSRR